MAKNYYWTGLSSATKPTGAQIPPGAQALESDTRNVYDWDGSGWYKTGTAGAAHVNPIPGPQKQARSRSLVAVTATRQKAEWPLGAGITRLTVLVTLHTTATVSAQAEFEAYALLSIDAENDTEADGNIGLSGAPPASSTADAQFIPIPLGVYVDIPLVTPLINGIYGGGRIDVRSVDGTPLNIWIGAN
jgi:hypothetical protein